MRTMMILTVLFATLLLLTGTTFARNCYCYKTLATNLDNPADSETIHPYPVLCFNDDNTGDIFTSFGMGHMSLFFDSLLKQALGYEDGCVGYFKFHGSELDVLTGIGYCDGDRWMLWGHRIDRNDPNCFD